MNTLFTFFVLDDIVVLSKNEETDVTAAWSATTEKTFVAAFT